jgi:amino acid adenylation domain-containing protein
MSIEPLSLPTDWPRPARVSDSFATLELELDREASGRLRNSANGLEVCLESMLLSGFCLTLGGVANQKDLAIGILSDKLTRLEVRLDPELPVSDYVRQLRRSLALQRENGDGPETSTFHVLFGVRNLSTGGSDLTVLLDDGGEKIRGTFTYATALFEPETIASLIATYQHLLEQLAASHEPDRKIKELSYLGERYYGRSIHEWNATCQPYPTEKTIHGLFEDQVRKSPDRTAVIFERRTLTYRELNERANRLAHWLRSECHVGPDKLVVLCLERSELMPEAVMGVLKAGGAYVPVDPEYPEDRTRYVLEDTQTTIVLTQTKYAAKIPVEIGSLRTVCLDDPAFRTELAAASGANPAPIATSLDLAYVIYTSGTTGRPKGAMLQHQGVVNRIVWMNEEYPLKPTDRILQKTPYVFDVSVWELFWAHWYGAALVYARPAGQKDNAYLCELIHDEKVTVIHFVPSMLGVFEEALDCDPLLRYQAKGLRYLFCSGEALPLSMVRKAHELLPDTEIHNLYGPTEASVDVLYYDCNDRNIASVPIGKPIANTTMYILDEFSRPLPVGGIGELYIGGDGVARGYLNRPELTAERFITNPFQTEKEKRQGRNERLYKTGDLARYRPDGNIEYLGRNDFQVKVRGFRIELGEIEGHLAKFPGVRQSVVLALEKAGSTYLAGYYVSEHRLDEGEILTWLKQHLPEYMVPAALIHLDRLPLTHNGKRDRKALPEPEFRLRNIYRAAENPTQNELCAIFADVLELTTEQVGIDDDFFHIGGSSILALRLLGRIHKQFNVRLAVSDIFTERTVSRLAAKLGDADRTRSLAVKLSKGSASENLFMIHPGNAGCEAYIPLARRLEGRYNCYGIDSYNLYHDDVISSLPVLAEKYLGYVKHVQRETGRQEYVFLGWSLGGQLAIEIAGILESEGVKDIRIYLLDTIISDERLDELNGQLAPEELEFVTSQVGSILGDAERCRRYLNAQIDLTLQRISRRLRHAVVVQFKAMLPDNVLLGANAMLAKAHVLGLEANNVELCLESPERQLQVVRLERADHYNLLKQAEDILHSKI